MQLDTMDCGPTCLRMIAKYYGRNYSLQVFPKTVYQTVTNDIYHPVVVKSKKKRWGLGLQAGYGYPGGFYVGGGISYDLFQW